MSFGYIFRVLERLLVISIMIVLVEREVVLGMSKENVLYFLCFMFRGDILFLSLVNEVMFFFDL